MKADIKRCLLLCLGIAAATGAWAAPRSMQEAQTEAFRWFGNSTLRKPALHSMPADEAMTYAWTATQSNGQPAVYVFNRGENDGWVMISAEDQTYTVLAYSDHGHWDAEDVPGGAYAWIATYSDQIEHAASATRKLQMPAATTVYTPVQPLCATLWGQDVPYNNLCPIDANGERSVTGCPATAAAQIMRKHSYPVRGTGSHTYEWTDSNQQAHTLSVDFSQTAYDWEQMISDYRSLPATDAQQAAVATLMYHCGVAAEMDYGSSSSSAYSRVMVGAMIEHFGYDKGIRVLAKDYMPEDSILQAVAADLNAGRPVFISARTVKNEGHAFVCDGMDAEGLIDINWGWNGKSNGYFRLSAMNPSEQGTGGSKTNRGYTERIILYTRIQPSAGGQYYHSLTCDNIRVLNPDCSREDKVKLVVDTLNNRGFAAWTGNLKLLVYKDGKLYKQKTITESLSPLEGGYYRHNVSYNADFSTLSTYPNGEYEMVVAARADDQENVTFPIYRKWLGEWRCKMTMTDDSIHVTVPTIEEPEHPEPANPAEYTFTRLSGYYYPTASTEERHRWKLQLATEDFYSKDLNADPDQMLLLYNVYSHSDKSFTGNHTAETSDTYRCVSATQYHGISADEENMITTDANEGACNVIYNQDNNSYTIRYRIRLYGKDYTGMAEVPLSAIRAYYGEDYNLHKKGDKITLDHQQPEGIEAITPQTEVRKILRNGQLLILRNGEVYTLKGERVNEL